MSQIDDDLIKHREVCFCPLHSDPDQAQSALLLLTDVTGIAGVAKRSAHCLEITYDLRFISLQIIEDALRDLGFHLDNGLLAKLKRALFYYTEETQRANLGDQPALPFTSQVFINRYQQLPHGCRDPRPPHWRGYL